MKPLSCPFCGSKDIKFTCVPYDWLKPPYNKTSNWVKCNSCEAMSGSYQTFEESVKAWNKRYIEEPYILIGEHHLD